MTKFRIISAIFVLLLVVTVGFLLFQKMEPPPKQVTLAVPYASQAPYGSWSAPWNESCEETSALMVEAYYQGIPVLAAMDVKKKIQSLVAWENKIFGRSENSSATQTARFINENLEFKTSVKRNPTIDEIKSELRHGRPVISLHDAHVLYQESVLGPTYHVVVITGYDDVKQEFIVNDPARIQERFFSYADFMKSLSDLNSTSQLASGVPSVIFTASR